MALLRYILLCRIGLPLCHIRRRSAQSDVAENHICYDRYVEYVGDGLKSAQHFNFLHFRSAGKFTISAGNTIMPVYTAELYPTSIRNVGVGACNVAAGLALILTPYLDILVSCRSTVSGCRFLLTNPFMWRGKLSTSTVSLDR